MPALFISHSSSDQEIAARVREGLEREGFASAFLDFEPEHGIPPGRRWEDEIYSQLRKADIVVFLATHAAVRSPWCHAELAVARSIGRRIVPVQLEPGAEHPLLRDTQWVPAQPDDGVHALAIALRRSAGEPLDAVEWDAHRAPSPYPGLRSFDERRAGVFYGREHEIATILDGLAWRAADGTERLFVVAGASGSGKSSLVRAGVIPRLARDPDWVVLPTFAPERSPLERLARSLARAFDAHTGAVPWERIHERLERGGDALAALALDLVDAAGDGRTVLLSIDQAEQLVTEVPRGDRITFLDLLVGAVEAHAPLRAVATIRSEYLGELVDSTALEGRAAPTLTLGRFSASRLAEVIERPADRAGIEFEAGLVGGMVEDTKGGAMSGGDPLPLLAFTLRRLYDERADPRCITRADYDRVGGVVGALRSAADHVYDDLAAGGMEEHVVPALLDLVYVEPEREPAGRGVGRSRFGRNGWTVIEAFRDARLLTTEGEGPTVHLSHEALLREWPLLTRAIEESRDALVARARLERDAREWHADERDPSYLMDGRRLRSARAVLATVRDADPVVTDFVVASRRRSGRQRWRARALVGLVVVVTGALLAVAVTSLVSSLRERAHRNAARAALVNLPGHRVALDEHEVTVRQYRLCVEEERCSRPADPGGTSPPLEATVDAGPVVLVDAGQARTFCAWIERRLPTLAQLKLAAQRLTHLLDLIEGGGREWTTTKKGIALRTLHRDPRSGDTATIDVNPAFRDRDLGFRCAAY